MVARGEAGGLGARAHQRMWEARRSQRASRESLGPYKDVHDCFGKPKGVGKSLMNGRPITGPRERERGPWAKSTFLRDRERPRPRKCRCSRDGPRGLSE